jgi:hypothetical protein
VLAGALSALNDVVGEGSEEVMTRRGGLTLCR